MKTSYKVALIAAIVLCVCAIVYPLVVGRGAAEPATSLAADRPGPSPAGPKDTEVGVATATVEPDATTSAALAHGGATPAARPAKPEPPAKSAAMPGPVVETPRRGPSPTVKVASAMPGGRLADASGDKPPTTRVDVLTATKVETTPVKQAKTVSAVKVTPVAKARTPAAKVKATPVPTKERPYTIRPGDTFSAIAKAIYGSERHAVDIGEANPRVNPLRLRPGQVIRLPAVAPPPATTSRKLAKLPDGSVYYVVRAKDTLSRIASRHYKNPRLWPVIYRANRLQIGTDPNRIQPGSRIVIPPNPDAKPNSG